MKLKRPDYTADYQIIHIMVYSYWNSLQKVSYCKSIVRVILKSISETISKEVLCPKKFQADSKFHESVGPGGTQILLPVSPVPLHV